MPAVKLELLKTEIAELFKKSGEPEDFLRGLNNLLERYGNYSYRAGEMIPSLRKIQKYHVSPQVINEIQQELRRFSIQQPVQSLRIAKRLWKERFFETRFLAICTLGEIPLSPLTLILECLIEWAQPEEEPEILTALFDQGTKRICREQLEAWLKVIQAWYEDTRPGYRMISLRSAFALVNDSSFINLPFVEKLITAPLIQGSPEFQNILEDILSALARRVPVETGFFLRQILSQNISPGTLPLIRKTLPFLDPGTRLTVRNLLNNLGQ
jgi:hypothetical protein